jgi:hypothetical protein
MLGFRTAILVQDLYKFLFDQSGAKPVTRDDLPYVVLCPHCRRPPPASAVWRDQFI